MRFLKIRSRGREATRILSTAFPNSRSRRPPRSATGIRADARAYTPARDGGLREKACSTAFPGQPAKAEPSRLCETSRCAPRPPSASASISAQRAALSANPARACCGVQCARFSCGGTFRCGAVSLIHFERTLCMCVKIAAMVRILPGGLALQAVGSRCSIRIWFMRSLAAKIRTASRPDCLPHPVCGILPPALRAPCSGHHARTRIAAKGRAGRNAMPTIPVATVESSAPHHLLQSLRVARALNFNP